MTHNHEIQHYVKLDNILLLVCMEGGGGGGGGNCFRESGEASRPAHCKSC